MMRRELASFYRANRERVSATIIRASVAAPPRLSPRRRPAEQRHEIGENGAPKSRAAFVDQICFCLGMLFSQRQRDSDQLGCSASQSDAIC
jgi:hypothetical protein